MPTIEQRLASAERELRYLSEFLVAIVCTVQNRHRAELDRLRSEADVSHKMIAAIVTEQARALKCVEIWTDNVNALHLKIDRVEGAMLKGKVN